MTVAVSAFYKFVPIDDLAALRARLVVAMSARGMKGTILIAAEGINGTISGLPSAVAAFLAELRTDDRFSGIVTKDTTAPGHPFKRLKVKIKPEIITFGQPAANPVRAAERGLAGTYVAPQDWNALIADPDVFVLDTRNAYEVAAGTFAGAADPRTRRFSDLPAYVQQNLDPAQHCRIAMFCTGGIRCEKASAYFKSLGFPEVYQLQGGILNYLAKIPPEKSMWQGACFVFDDREAVAETLLEAKPVALPKAS
jgi:UPF0176 protein